MVVANTMLALVQLLGSALSVLTPHSTRFLASGPSVLTDDAVRVMWSGELPPGDDANAGAAVSACTFAVGPPGPPATALCPAFTAYCAAFRDEMRSKRIRTLKSSPPLKPYRTNKVNWNRSSGSGDEEGDDGDPLKDVKFRSGCVGGTGLASDGTYLSGYTATCIVDGVDWVPFVFDAFLRAEFAPDTTDGPLPIYTSFVGCQVPAHL